MPIDKKSQVQAEVVVRSIDGNNIIFRQKWKSPRFPGSLDVELRKYFFHNKIMPIVYLRDSFNKQNAIITFQLLDAEKVIAEKVVKAKQFPEKSKDPRWTKLSGKMISTIFDISSLKAGAYSIKIKQQLPEKKEKSAEVQFKKPVKPEWLNSQIGKEDRIPPAYYPLKITGEKIFNKQMAFSFKDNLLPSKISNMKHSILAAPVTLTAQVDNNKVQWEYGKTDIVQKSPSTVTVKTEAKNKAVTINNKTTISFDGFMRFDLDVKLEPHKNLSALYLDIPVKKEFAEFFMGAPDKPTRGAGKPWPSWSGWPTGFTPIKHVQGPFTFFFWTGTDKLGLTFTCKNHKNWIITQHDKTIEIIPGKDKVIFRVNFIDAPKAQKRNFTINFALQPTPSKPLSPKKVTGFWWFYYDFLYKPNAKHATGVISYDAQDNIDSDKGAIHLWVNFPEKIVENKHGFDIFRLYWATGEKLRLMWNKNGTMRCLIEQKNGLKANLRTGKLHFEFDKPLLISISYGKYLALYIDGKLIKRVKCDGLLNKPLAGARIHLLGKMPFDAIKIENKPYYGLTLPDCTVDDNTLLLDKFERWTGSDDKLLKSHPVKSAHNNTSYGTINGVSQRKDGWVTLEKNMNYFEYWRQVRGWDWVMLAEYWGESEGLLYTWEKRAKLKRFVKAAHKAGLKVMLHSTAVLGELSQVYKDYSDEVLVEPKKCTFYRRHREPQRAYTQSFTGQWQDYMVYMAEKLIKDFDIDGLYFDGNHCPVKDYNIWHGAGYYDEKGNLQPSWQVYEYREWLRRIKNVGESIKPGFRIEYHVLFPFSPTLTFADSILTGEDYLMLANAHYNGSIRKCLTLPAFRASKTCNAQGVQVDFLTNSQGSKFKKLNAMAISLIHGVSLRWEQYSGVNKAIKEFSVDTSSPNWHPYFNNSDKIQVTPATVKVSYFKGKDGRYLFFLSNLSENPVTAKIDFLDEDLISKSGFRSIVTGKWFNNKNHTISLNLKPWTPEVLTSE